MFGIGIPKRGIARKIRNSESLKHKSTPVPAIPSSNIIENDVFGLFDNMHSNNNKKQNNNTNIINTGLTPTSYFFLLVVVIIIIILIRY